MTEEIGYPKFLKYTAVNKLKDNIYCGNLSDSWSIGGAQMEDIQCPLRQELCLIIYLIKILFQYWTLFISSRTRTSRITSRKTK